jgi:hypothetical protein
MAGHRCYFADPSGGFGWPACVICGAPASIEENHGALRACCQTTEAEGHVFTCQSVDARVKRGLSPFPTS